MHELNNPAAAVGRTSELLNRVYTKLGATTAALIGVEDDELLPKPSGAPSDALARADAMDELGRLLDRIGVDDPYGDLSSSLANAGFGVVEVEGFIANLDENSRVPMIEWLALRTLASEMLGEISAAARRISELVATVRSYTFLDHAPIQIIDPIEGIDDTLLILKHELKNVEVRKDIYDDLHQIEAPGRNLNQVWANLIENAVDAMDGSGTLTIKGKNEGGEVVVTIADTGSGIDPDVQDRIFEPFFTTKEPGKGTGLGLHTVHNTVSRAGGTINVSSGPNGTTFTLRFPSVGGHQ